MRSVYTRSCSLFAIAALMAVAPASAAPLAPAAKRIAEDVRVLASDDFQGRLPGTIGETRTLAYLTRQFRAAGLSPGGELVKGQRTWFQTVPVLNLDLAGPPTIAVSTPAGPLAVTQGTDLVLRPSAASAAHEQIDRAQLVFVGYGISAPERGWDDFKGVDLKGKIAVFIFGEPVDADGKRLFPGTSMGPYGSPGPKTRQAIARGAIGALLIHDPKVLGYQWQTTANAFQQTRQELADEDTQARDARVEGAIRFETAVTLFQRAGLDYAAIAASANSRDFKPITLPGTTLSASLDVKRTQIASKNVIGILRGAAHPYETLIYTAHWDHQGVGPPDATGDRVYNGADDNASSVACLIEIAREMARRKRADRSVVFMSVTMEEPGLLGSEYYARHPIYPLETTVAAINMETMYMKGPAHDFSNNAHTETDLTPLLEAAGARQGRTYVAEPFPKLFLRRRSDHFSLAKRGVPPVFFLPGLDLVDGGNAAGARFFADYFANRYHRQSDNYSPDWDTSGMAQDAALLEDFGYRLANSRQWPEWTAGGEFKAVRDASKAQRH